MNKEIQLLTKYQQIQGGKAEIYNRKLPFSGVERLCFKGWKQTIHNSICWIQNSYNVWNTSTRGTAHSNICKISQGWGEGEGWSF